MKEFCKTLRKHAERIIYWQKKMIQIKRISLTKTLLYMEKTFSKDNKKLKYHCHFREKYRGAAHNKCNMNYKITIDIPVVFHNGSI